MREDRGHLKTTMQASLLDIHTKEVIQKSLASIIVKVIAMAVGVLVSIFIGRHLGPEGLGTINLANRIVSLMLVFTMFGMQKVLVKQIAIGYEKKNWQLVGDSIFTASVFNGIIALVLSIIGYVLTPFLAQVVFQVPDLEIPLKLAFIVMLPQTLSRIIGAGLNGFRKIWQSNLVNETLSNWVIGILLLSLYLTNVEINVISIAFIYAIGRITVTAAVFAYWKILFRFKGKRNWIAGPMMKMAIPMLLVSSTTLIAANADTVMLGWLSTTKDVGLYGAAAQIALLVSFFLQVTNAAISPKIASLYADGKLGDIEKMVKKITGGLTVIAIVILLVFVVLGSYLLALWGEEFRAAYLILVILGIGQFFNISTGCAGLLLVMCGFEKIQGKISLISVILNLILNYILIQHYGSIGAALATALTVAGENISRLILAKKYVGVLTVPIKLF